MSATRLFRGPALVLGACLALATAGASLAVAQVGSAEVEPVEAAPVILDGNRLFQVRGISTFSADKRAHGIARRIAAVAADRTVSPDSLRIVPQELGRALVIGGESIVVLLPSDAELESVSLTEFAVACQLRTREAILNYRRDREPGRNLRSAGLVTAIGLALVLALMLVVRFTHRIELWFARRYERTADSAAQITFRLIGGERIWWLLRLATAAIRTATVLVLVYLYLQWALALFPWTRLIGRTLLSLVSSPVHTMVTGFIGFLPELFFLIVLTVVARWALRGLGAFMKAVEHGTVVIPDFDPEWAMPTFRIVRVVLIALFVVVAYPYIPGSDSGAFKGVSLLLGLLVSVGSSSVVSNVIAGYTMIYRRAFRVGDRIRINDHFGDVVAVRPLVTTLRTPKNEEIVIPNSDILTNAITNYSALARREGLILHTTVGIGYETPWRQVEAMLLEAAARTEGLAAAPEPFVLHKSLGDFCVVYELNVPCASAQQMNQLYTALHRNILDVFNENSVQIMTPAYESDTPEPKLVRSGDWYAAPAAPPAGRPAGDAVD